MNKIKRSFVKEWNKRKKLYAEGEKLYAEGYKLRAEGDKLYAEGYKLRAEGDKIFFSAITAKFGNIKITKRIWNKNNEPSFHLENGEVYS